MKRASRNVIRIVLLFAWVPSLGVCQDYDVTGVAETETFRGQKVRHQVTYEFRMAVRGCNWNIWAKIKQRKENGQTQANNFDYIEASYDGSANYFIASVETIAKQSPDPSHVAIGRIGSGSVPFNSDPFVQVLWLGFASHCTFSNMPHAQLPSLFAAKQDPSKPQIEGFVRGFSVLSAGFPKLPETAAFTYELVGAKPPYGDTYQIWRHLTNATFSVLQSTNCGTMRLPTSLVLSGYNQSGELSQRTKVLAATLNLANEWIEFRPKLPGLIVIEDARFGTRPLDSAVQVAVTNWPTKAQVERALTSQKLLEPPNAKTNSTIISRRAMVILTLLVIGALIPTIFVRQLKL